MNAPSVALTADVGTQLCEHLLRLDGQEDICLATYAPSTGSRRFTGVINTFVPPRSGDRAVHGNASITGAYVLRVATEAARRGKGVVLMHSHPTGRGWQPMSTLDTDAERSHAYLVHAITGQPLIGMTLAGDDAAWSARMWAADGTVIWCESVRTLGEQLRVSWNDQLRPPPTPNQSQLRTISAWGEAKQADLARLRILVVGAGSVGLDVALRLAATGIQHVAVMDFDRVETVNLDRLVGATRLDAALQRPKVEVAGRLMSKAATASRPEVITYDMSVCEPAGLAVALDYDVIFSCVDRPWPRAVLNQIAYTDLIPVIDGGIAIDAFTDGDGMRNATWRTHVVHPGRACMACNKQLDLATVALDRQGLLDDPIYIAGADPALRPQRQNVAALSAGVSASLLAQFISLVIAPGGRGEPGPLRYSLSTHALEHLPGATRANCPVESRTATGDSRVPMTGSHALAHQPPVLVAPHTRPLSRRLCLTAARLAETASSELASLSLRR
jgi:hypothetical protein